MFVRIMATANQRPPEVTGTISPNPTVVSATSVKQRASPKVLTIGLVECSTREKRPLEMKKSMKMVRKRRRPLRNRQVY